MSYRTTISNRPRTPKQLLNIRFGLDLKAIYSIFLSKFNAINKELDRKVADAQDKYNEVYNSSDKEKRKDYDKDFTSLENYYNELTQKLKDIDEFEKQIISEINKHREEIYVLSNITVDLRDHLKDVQIGSLEERMRDLLKNLPKEELDKLPEHMKKVIKKDYKGGKHRTHTRKRQK